MTTLHIHGSVCTYTEGSWSCPETTLERILNNIMPDGGFSASDPHPDQSAVDLVLGYFPDAEVVGVAPALEGEEGPELPSFLGALTFTPDAVLITVDGTRRRLTWDMGNGHPRNAVLDGWPVADIRMNEIAARHFLWTHDLLPDSVAESPRVLGEADAAVALANHLRAMDEAKL